jgi:D-glycero-beta-D-manno-heptose 1-phosphate adenylyltransferase
LLPDVLVKGADWPIERIVGAREVLAAGGKVINIPLVADLSTTSLISRIKGEP